MEHGVGDNLSDIFDNYTREKENKQVMYERATLTYVRYKKSSAEIGMYDMYVCMYDTRALLRVREDRWLFLVVILFFSKYGI